MKREVLPPGQPPAVQNKSRPQLGEKKRWAAIDP